jgi:hypothetical protein
MMVSFLAKTMIAIVGWWFHHDEGTPTLFIWNGKRIKTIWNQEVF